MVQTSKLCSQKLHNSLCSLSNLKKKRKKVKKGCLELQPIRQILNQSTGNNVTKLELFITPTSYIFCFLIQIQSSRLRDFFNIAEQLACLSGVCQSSENGVGKEKCGKDPEPDSRCSVFVCYAFLPGLTVITVLEKTVAVMPLRKASNAILASDMKST